MMGFIFFIHAIVCVVLAFIILMQSGRGGGLTEAFASAESIFGAQTNSTLIRATTVLASLFLVTSLTLTFLSSRQDKSLMTPQAVSPQKQMNVPDESKVDQAAPAAVPNATK